MTPLRFPADSPRWTDLAPSVAVIAVTGADRVSFLTRIMSGDLPPAPGAARTALLGPKGNLVAAAVATVTEAAVFLETERSRGDALASTLDRYRIADAVEIRLLEAPSLGRREAPGEEPAPPGSVALRDGGFRRRDFRPWPSFTTLGSPPPAGTPATPEEQEYLRILAGEPRWGAELDEASRPLASGLAAHVRLGRGCYIGQEYVARQAHRGRVPRLLRRLEIEGGEPPAPGAALLSAGTVVGRITSAAPRPAGWPETRGPVALAVLRAEVPPGATVEIPGLPRARVAALPDP